MQVKNKFTLVGGHPALDFANTLDNRYDPERLSDQLGDYDDFLDFARETGVLKKSIIKSLRAVDEEGKTAALTEARVLRDAVERVFGAAARGAQTPREELAVVNRHVRDGALHRVLAEKPDRSFRWRWSDAEGNSHAPLWAISLAAAELLVSDQLQYVRECGAETCRWLFLDLSKNHSRRWCDMRTCGNRSKARKFYEKKTEERSQETEVRRDRGVTP